jgi:hypothetical protein
MSTDPLEIVSTLPPRQFCGACATGGYFIEIYSNIATSLVNIRADLTEGKLPKNTCPSRPHFDDYN